MPRYVDNHKLAMAQKIILAMAGRPDREIRDKIKIELKLPSDQMAYYWFKNAKPQNFASANTNPSTIVSDMAPTINIVPEIVETDEEIAARLRQRFTVLNMMANGVKKGKVRGVIVSGPAGLGKSFEVERVMADLDNVRLLYVKGFMRPTGLYKALWEQRHKGSVLVIDDGDSIFFDGASLNLLKAALDTSDRRRMAWKAETQMVDRFGDEVETSFDFEGSIIFLTNYDFDMQIARGHNLAEQFKTLISRCHYIDLGIRQPRDYIVRMNQVVKEEKMLEGKGFTAAEETDIMNYVYKNQESLREMTLRIVLKIADNYRNYHDKWEMVCNLTCLKGKA